MGTKFVVVAFSYHTGDFDVFKFVVTSNDPAQAVKEAYRDHEDEHVRDWVQTMPNDLEAMKNELIQGEIVLEVKPAE